MEAVISNMVKRFETGAITRRELIQGLAVLATAGATGSAAVQERGFQATTIDHISITEAPKDALSSSFGSCFASSR